MATFRCTKKNLQTRTLMNEGLINNVLDKNYNGDTVIRAVQFFFITWAKSNEKARKQVRGRPVCTENFLAVT
jgi:hypothetical protein